MKSKQLNKIEDQINRSR